MRQWRKLTTAQSIWVSDDGLVANESKGWYLPIYVNKPGYSVANFEGSRALVHRLVANLFIGPIPKGFVVNHLNGRKHDNRVENLELATHQDNLTHAVVHLGYTNLKHLLEKFGGPNPDYKPSHPGPQDFMSYELPLQGPPFPITSPTPEDSRKRATAEKPKVVEPKPKKKKKVKKKRRKRKKLPNKNKKVVVEKLPKEKKTSREVKEILLLQQQEAGEARERMKERAEFVSQLERLPIHHRSAAMNTRIRDCREEQAQDALIVEEWEEHQQALSKRGW